MDPQTTRLASLLDELVDLLTTHSQTHWAEWVARDLAWVRAGDGHGLTHFLTAFGGMGSLNDVVLEPRAEDERFDSIREEAWTLATALRRDAEGDD